MGINSALLCSKHKRLVNITQENRFDDVFAIISMLLTLIVSGYRVSQKKVPTFENS